MRDQEKPWLFPILLLLGAFLLRLVVVLALRDLNVGPRGSSSSDDVQFNNLGWQVAQGNGFVNDQEKPTSFRAPGFPLFLAGLYLLAGQNFPLAYVSFCVLGAVTCLLSWLLAREVLAERLALVTAVLVAVYPPYVHLATTFMSENLFVPLLALGVWLVLRYLKTRALATLAVAGLALGAATLTRPFSLLLLPIVAGVVSWSTYRAGRLRFGPIFVFGVTFLAVIAPWTYRNYSVHGRFVLIATNGGSTFYGGNNGKVVSTFRNYGSWFSTTELPHRDLIDATPNEVAHDKMEWQLGCDWLTSNPRYWPLLIVGKVARLCLWVPEFDAARLWVRAAGYLPFLVLLIPGFLTCLRHRYWTPPWLVIHGTMLATVVTALIFWGSPRFRDAGVPLLMLYAALGIQVLITPIQRLRTE